MFSWKGKCYMPKPVPGLPRWEPKSVVEVRVGVLTGKCGCGSRDELGFVWKTKPSKHRQRLRPKKKQGLRPPPPASPLQITPDENLSPASIYNVTQHRVIGKRISVGITNHCLTDWMSVTRTQKRGTPCRVPARTNGNAAWVRHAFGTSGANAMPVASVTP